MAKLNVGEIWKNRAGNKVEIVAVGFEGEKPVTARNVETGAAIALSNAGKSGGGADSLDLIKKVG